MDGYRMDREMVVLRKSLLAALYANTNEVEKIDREEQRMYFPVLAGSQAP